MSPQCLQGIAYSSKNDIWSLSIMFFELLYGCTPWENSQNTTELIRNIYEVPIRLNQNIEISNGSRDFLVRSLVIEEEGRISWEGFFEHELMKKNVGNSYQENHISNIYNIS